MNPQVLFSLLLLDFLGQSLLFNLPPVDSTVWPDTGAFLSSNNSHQAQIAQQTPEPNNLVSLTHLLQQPEKYHQQTILIRGRVARLELHLDTTNHFIDFVFFLKDGEQQVLVFGRHDRTMGDIQLTSDHMVEVVGIFWKERVANGHRLTNNIEAQLVRFHPPLHPDRA